MSFITFQQILITFILIEDIQLICIVNFTMAANDFFSEVVIPKDFARIPLVLIGMNLQLWFAGHYVSKLRKQLFNKQFMKKHFGEIHANELKQEIQPGGYPDMGNGIYSQKLSYSDWYRFNVAQRIHLNYVENINIASIAVVVAGIVKSNYGVAVGIAYILGRFLYSFFYKKQKGARNPGRIVGIVLCHLATLAGIGIFVWKFFKNGFTSPA